MTPWTVTVSLLGTDDALADGGAVFRSALAAGRSGNAGALGRDMAARITSSPALAELLRPLERG
jgi:hypothetical protein